MRGDEMHGGIHAMSAEEALMRHEQGMRFLAVGSELRMMSVESEKTVKMLWPDRQRKEGVKY